MYRADIVLCPSSMALTSYVDRALRRWGRRMDSLSSSSDRGYRILGGDSSHPSSCHGKGNSVCRAWRAGMLPSDSFCRTFLGEYRDGSAASSTDMGHGCPPIFALFTLRVSVNRLLKLITSSRAGATTSEGR